MKVSQKDIDKRRALIIEYVQQKTYCSTADLRTRFQLSPSTLTRDLDQLQRDGYLVRYHGGVRVAAPLSENIPYNLYSRRNQYCKDAIAKYVTDNLIVDNNYIFINGSSTALYLYRYLNKNVTVITNNAKALFANASENVHFILIGGEVSSHNGANILCGEFARNMINSITADICILGVSGISAEGGITSSSYQDISVNRAMLSQTKERRIVVADHSKIGKTYNFRFGNIQDITHLITDSNADEKELDLIRNMGVEVITVDV